MTRIDLYGPVHKGLRAALFATTAQAGRTDWEDAGAARAAAGDARRLLAFLEEHSAHEDAVLMPALAAACPELHADLRSDHARVDGLHHELGALATRLDAADGAERASLGRRLHEKLAALTAEHLRHMAREEVDATRVLWANHDDAALGALHGRILSAIPPARMSEWLALLAPAVSLPERVGMLGGLRAAVPPPVFADLVAPARAALGARAWATTAAALGL